MCLPPLHGSVWSTWPLLVQHWVHTRSWECLCSRNVIKYSVKQISSVQPSELYPALHTAVYNLHIDFRPVSIARSSTSVIHCTNTLVWSRIGFIRIAPQQSSNPRPPTLYVHNTHAYTQQGLYTVTPSGEIKLYLPVKNSSCAAMSRSQLARFLQVGCNSVRVPAPGTKSAVPGSHHKVSLNLFKTNMVASIRQFSWVSCCSPVSLHF